MNREKIWALILYTAHGSPVDSWPLKNHAIEPAVLLAFVSAATNVLLNYALSGGSHHCVVAKSITGRRRQ